jgi:hypothetical protein
MRISAKIIADSIPWWPASGTTRRPRLVTFELTYPRFVHSEVLTHRAFSRNAASSRAIPVRTLLKQVWNDPAMPVYWGSNRPGMQAGAELTGWRLWAARKLWVTAGCMMVGVAWLFIKIGLHKQIANRVLEPWMWMKTILTGTEWANLFAQRRTPEAQPEFKALADEMYREMRSCRPTQLQTGTWHLPYIRPSEWLAHRDGDLTVEDLKKMSTARCARVSYLNHDGTAPKIAKDIALHDFLAKQPHPSPFEHVCTPDPHAKSNVRGWRQYRAEIPNENVTTYPGIV